MIASQLLVQDALEKRLLVAPLIGALPGGRYYFVTGREKRRGMTSASCAPGCWRRFRQGMMSEWARHNGRNQPLAPIIR